MDEFGWIGSIGILIYGLLLVYTLSRLVSSLCHRHRHRHSLKYFNYKIAFHFVFAIYCSCETIYYSSLLIEDG